MAENKNYFGWFEKKISKKTGKEYGSGSFSPKDIEKLNELSKQSPKGYVNFFWSIYQDKPSITLCEPRDLPSPTNNIHDVANEMFSNKVSIDDVPF
jgi:hypothetical protein